MSHFPQIIREQGRPLLESAGEQSGQGILDSEVDRARRPTVEAVGNACSSRERT